MNNQPAAYQQIIAKAWSNPEYKARFMGDPKGVFAEAGMQIPDNVEVKVVADTDEVVHLVLPKSPAGETLSDKDLKQVAGGTLYIPSVWLC